MASSDDPGRADVWVGGGSAMRQLRDAYTQRSRSERYKRRSRGHFLGGGTQHTQKHCIHLVQVFSLPFLFFLSLSSDSRQSFSGAFKALSFFLLSFLILFFASHVHLYNKPEQHSEHKLFPFFLQKSLHYSISFLNFCHYYFFLFYFFAFEILPSSFSLSVRVDYGVFLYGRFCKLYTKRHRGRGSLDLGQGLWSLGTVWMHLGMRGMARRQGN